jgi:hypothetical protein
VLETSVLSLRTQEPVSARMVDASEESCNIKVFNFCRAQFLCPVTCVHLVSTIMTTYPLGAHRVMVPIQQDNLRCADRDLIGGMTNGWFIIHYALTMETLGLRLVLPDSLHASRASNHPFGVAI